jgi:hypothetical protein
MTATLENAARDFDPENRGFGTAEDGTPLYPKVVTGVWLRKHSMDDFLTASAVAGVAGSVILTLSALGIYGVVGLMVATRTRELAVRVALGASRRRVLGMVLFDVVKLVLPGVVVGLILTAAFVRLNGDNLGIPLSNVEPWLTSSAPRSRSSSPSWPASPLHAAPPRFSRWWPCERFKDFPPSRGLSRSAAIRRGKLMTPGGSSMTRRASVRRKRCGIRRRCSGTHLGLVTALIPRSVLSHEWNTGQPSSPGGSASFALGRGALRARPGIRLLAHCPR